MNRNANAEALRHLARRSATCSLPEAGVFYGAGRNMSYELARRDEFPVPVLKVGIKLRVSVAAIAHDLGIDLEGDGAARAVAVND